MKVNRTLEIEKFDTAADITKERDTQSFTRLVTPVILTRDGGRRRGRQGGGQDQ